MVTGNLTVVVPIILVCQDSMISAKIPKFWNSENDNYIKWFFGVKWGHFQGQIWLNVTDFTWDISEHV